MTTHLFSRARCRLLNSLRGASFWRCYGDEVFVTDAAKEGLKPGVPWAQLGLDFPYREILQEAERLLPHYIDDNEAMRATGVDPAKNKRWNRWSLDLQRIATANRWNTRKGLRDHKYEETRFAAEAPVTMDFIKNRLPHVKLHDFGFRLLKPGGYLDTHIDKFEGRMSINFVLSNPPEAYFWLDGPGNVPMTPGTAWVVSADNYYHKVENKSATENRFHLIINGQFGHDPAFRKLILKRC